MKLITIVKRLQAQGVDIRYRVRSDGGILVTQVSGMRFTAAEGNRFVRNLTGEALSESQVRQRQAIKPPKKISPAMRKKLPIPEDVKKEIQKLQRLYRKDKKKGKPTIKNYRYVAERYGEAEAKRLLKQSEYYVKGIAYDENIEALIQRLQQIKTLVEIAQEDDGIIQNAIDATREYQAAHRENFTEDKIKWLLAIIYDFEAQWNIYQSGGDSDFADPNQILSSFASNYITTLRS